MYPKSNYLQFKRVTKRINFFINKYYMDTLCNISVCKVPRRGYIVRNGVHPPDLNKTKKWKTTKEKRKKEDDKIN